MIQKNNINSNRNEGQHFISNELKLYVKFLLVFNIISYILVKYLPDFLHFDLFNGLVHIFLILNFFGYHRNYDKVGKIVMLLAIYVFLMATITWLKYGYFDRKTIKFLISSSFFIIGYNLITNKITFKYYLDVILLTLNILLFSILLFNLLGIEARKVYSESSINLGAQGVNTVKVLLPLVFPLLISFFSFKISKHKKYLIIVSFIFTLIFLLLAQKRGALLGFSFGFIIYLIKTPYRSKNIKFVLFSILIIALTSPLYWHMVEDTFKDREENYYLENTDDENQLEKEARYVRFYRYIGDLKNRNIIEIIFGVGFASEMGYYGVSRMIHVDYTMFADGTGILGLLLYLGIYFSFFRKLRKYERYFTNDMLIKNIIAVSYSIIILALFLAISGLSHAITLRAIILLYMGSVLGFLDNRFNEIDLLNRQRVAK